MERDARGCGGAAPLATSESGRLRGPPPSVMPRAAKTSSCPISLPAQICAASVVTERQHRLPVGTAFQSCASTGCRNAVRLEAQFFAVSVEEVSLELAQGDPVAVGDDGAGDRPRSVDQGAVIPAPVCGERVLSEHALAVGY